MIPEIWLVLVSRKVNGMPVGVEPTRTACWALAAPLNPAATAAATRMQEKNLGSMMIPSGRDGALGNQTRRGAVVSAVWLSRTGR